MMQDVGSNQSVFESLAGLKQDMEEDFYTILVVGEFKRGKTTFVNALLGEDLLISDVLPETATIQAVIHGDDNKAQVVFQDGTVINGKANKDFLREYSAKNADVANKIRYIKISNNNEIIGPKTVLVDTPGVADLDEQRVQVTYDFLPKANAVLFVLDAVSPLKKSEKEFIEEQLIPQGISKIIFVVNKMDIFDDEEEDAEKYIKTVKKRIQETFTGELDDNLIIIPVSALLALKGALKNDQELIKQSGIEDVKQAIRNILHDGDIEQQKLEQYKRRFMHIVKTWELQVNKEVSMFKTDTDTLRNEIANVSIMQANCDTRYEMMERYVKNEQEVLHAMLIKSLDKFHEDLLEELTYQVNRFSGRDFAAFVERDLPHVIKKQTECWMNSHMRFLNSGMDRLEKKLSYALSIYFNKHIMITSTMEEIHIHPEIDLQGKDTRHAALKAGGGVALAMVVLSAMTPIGFLAPLITMYALPCARDGAQEKALENAKRELLPQLKNVTYPYVCELRDKVEMTVDVRFKEMLNSVSSSYNRFVDEYKRNMEKCIEMKQKDEILAQKKLSVLQNNCACIEQLYLGIEGV